MVKYRERRWLWIGTALFVALGSLKMYRDAKKKSDLFSEGATWEADLGQSGETNVNEGNKARNGTPISDRRDAENLQVEDEEKREAKLLYVHVAGRVKKPGLYTFHDGARIDDAIRSAGGFCEDADSDAVNLSMKLADEMKITVPAKGDPTKEEEKTGGSDLFGEDKSEPVVQSPDGGDMSAASDGRKIDLNTATLEELMTLPSVGEKRAKDIIAYRSKKPFSDIEELKQIAGIGEKTFAKLRDYIEIR